MLKLSSLWLVWLCCLEQRCLLLLAAGDKMSFRLAVYRLEFIDVVDDGKLLKFSELSEENNLDIWRTRHHDEWKVLHVDVSIQATFREEFEAWLYSQSIKYNVKFENINKLIKEQFESNRKFKESKRNMRSKRAAAKYGPHHTVVGTYATLDEINDWLDKLVIMFPFCEVINIGKSYEGRDMKLLKIAPGKNKSVVFVDSGIHAREWLAPASSIYTIEKIIKHIAARNNTVYEEVFSKYEYHFVPVVNPDGYVFTFNETNVWSNRMWRKTRKPYESCIGVDANRNFDIAFAKHAGRMRRSHNPCAQTYHGPFPFSEPETGNIRDHIQNERDRIKLYMTVHCCADSLILPYTYTRTQPGNIEELRRVGNLMVKSMRSVKEHPYTFGTAENIFNQLFSGISMDWVLVNTNARYAYVFESRGDFLSPASEINPSGEELYRAIRTAVFVMNRVEKIIANWKWIVVSLVGVYHFVNNQLN